MHFADSYTICAIVQYYSRKVETFAFIDFNGGNKRKLCYCLQLSEHKYSFCFWV